MNETIDIPLWWFFVGWICVMVCAFILLIRIMGWLLSVIAQWGINRQIKKQTAIPRGPNVQNGILDEFSEWEPKKP